MQGFIKRWKTTGKGIKNAMSDWRFWIVAVISLLFFLFIFNLLSTGNNFLQLIIALPFFDKFSVIGEVYLNFIVNIFSLEKILMLIASVGQSLIIGMIFFLWKSRRKLDDTALLESAGASLIALIGAGCPMCGGTILFPIILSIFGASATAFLQGFSVVLMLLALIPIAFAIRRLGFMCSMQTVSKERMEGENEKS